MHMPLNIGWNLDSNQPFLIDPQTFNTHYQFIGATGTGKTTAIETLLQEQFTSGNRKSSYFIFDPFGSFSRRLLRFIADQRYCSQEVRDRLVYVEPANQDYTTVLHPLRFTSRANQDYQVARAMDLLLRGFETQDVSGMPRLRRFLHQALFDISQLGLPLSFIRYLLSPGITEHDRLLERLPLDSQAIWQDVMHKHGNKAQEFLDSTRSRVALFSDNVILERMFSSAENLLDIPRFMEEGRIVIVNLTPGDRNVHWNVANTAGSIMINEILNHGITMMNRRNSPNDTYLVVDEFQRFLGPDVYDFLPIVRNMGIHLLLAHQSFSQLEKGDIDLRPLIAQARSRMMFANDFEDADLLAEEIASLKWDPDEIKHQIQSLRQRLVGHRTHINRGGNVTHSSSSTETHQIKRGKSEGETRLPDGGYPTRSSGDQTSYADVTGASTSEATGENWSETLVPIHKDFYEVSSVQFRSREEIVHYWGQRMRELGEGKCYFKQVKDPNLYRLAIRYLPPEESARIDDAVDALLEKNFDEGPFISTHTADRQIAKLRDELVRGPIERIISDQGVDSKESDRHRSLFDD